MDQVKLAISLSLLAQQLIEAIVRPIKIKKPTLDLWWLIYVTWVVGSGLAWLAQLNLLPGVMDPLAGRIITAVVVGGGSQLISSVFKGLDSLKELAKANQAKG